MVVVTNHLNAIHDALEDYEKHHREFLDAAVSQQMQKLTSQIKSSEVQPGKPLQQDRIKPLEDDLTGLPNHSAYAERSFHELRRFKRYHRSLVLAVCDLDNFKQVNDRYGRQAGDKALKLIAKVLRKKIRSVDFLARHGGEEFVLLMPETNAQQALKVLDKVRSTIANIPFKMNRSPLSITVSIGVTEFVADDSMDTVFERADKALFKAKSTGRNKCEVQLKSNKGTPSKSSYFSSPKSPSRSKEISFK